MLPTRILVVDDHHLVRSGICLSLQNLTDMTVVGQAASGKEALQLCAELKPDLILLDLKIAETDGRELAPVLLQLSPNSKILIVTSCLDTALIPQLFALGVKGFFNKTDDREELLKAIRTVCAGRQYVCPRVAKDLNIQVETLLENPFDLLSERELQVVLLLACGLTHHEICKKLDIHISTLKTYRARFFEKLPAKNDVELVLLAKRYGLLT